MARRSAATSPSEFDDCSYNPAGLADALSAMEAGGCERQQHHDRGNHEPEDRGQCVIVAATEARDQEGEHRAGVARAHRFLAEVLRVVLVGLVVVFTCFFVYVWVDSFRKGRFDHTLGLVTVTFCGLVVCVWASRRRLRLTTRLPERIIVSGPMQRRPKGVPPRAQQSFQYFVYPELSSSSSGSETSIASSDDGSGVGFSSTTFKASADCAADVHTRDGEAGISGDGGGDAERGESAACAGELPANTPALVEKAGGRDYSVDADGGVALSPRSPPLPLESPREREGHQQQEAQERPLQDLEGLEQQRQGVHEHPETTKEEDPCSWTECSVCLEAFSGGDSACRTPCGHIFHAECINDWLDQNRSCPECRLELLNEDGTIAGGEPRSENISPGLSPASTLPDEAFQISFSNRGACSPSLPTATEPLPTPVVPNHGSTTPSEPPEASRPDSPHRALPARTADLPPLDTKSEVAELTTDTTDAIDSEGNARGEAGPAVAASPTASCPGPPRAQTPSPVGKNPVVCFPDVTPEPERQRGSRRVTHALDDTAVTARRSSVAPCARVLDSPDYEAPTSPATFARQLRQFAADSGRSPLAPPTTASYIADDVTDLNTAINAIPYDNGASAAAAAVNAPYAGYFGSPSTHGSSSPRTPVVRFLGLGPEFGETAPSCRTPQTLERPTAPYADFFNSPGSPSPTSTALVPFRGSPPGAAAAAEPAPYACYLDSPPLSSSPLSTANLVDFRLSPEIVRLHGAANTRGFRSVPASSPLPPPPFAALSLPPGTSRLPRIGARSGNDALMARTQHEHQRQHREDVLQEYNNGRAHQRSRTGQPRHVLVHQAHHGRIIQEVQEATSPPRPPPRLTQSGSPGLAGGEQWLPPPPPPPLSFTPPTRPADGRQSRGAFRLRSSPQLVRGGGADTTNREASSGGREEGGLWVWPVGSDPVQDNRTCVGVHDRIRISFRDEGADVRPQGGGRWQRGGTHHENGALVEGTSGGDISGRWVWQPDPMAHHQHRQHHQQEFPQMRHLHQYDRHFEEDSLSETEEHDERFWERVMYHIWA